MSAVEGLLEVIIGTKEEFAEDRMPLAEVLEGLETLTAAAGPDTAASSASGGGAAGDGGRAAVAAATRQQANRIIRRAGARWAP